MLRKSVAVLILAALVCWHPPTASAQRDQNVLRSQVNQGTVSIISGGVTGTYIRIASDLAAVLDEGNELRVLPIIGKGSLQNITDILYLKGIDIGIVQSDVLAYIKNQGIHPTIEERIRYITKLYNEEFHLLAARDIVTVQDLAGKRVNLDVVGSGTFITATTILDTLGVKVEPVNVDQALALEQLKNGEIAAMVYVAGKPATIFSTIEAGLGLHLLDVAPTPELLETYLPSGLDHQDYPNLIAEGESVQTLAVGAVMAVYNWDPSGDRFAKVERFVNVFFDTFSEFLKPPRHPKWQEVNFAAVVPGWKRFKVAEEWLQRNVQAQPTATDTQMRTAFDSFLQFLKEQDPERPLGPLTEQQREAMFKQFLQWQSRQRP